MKGKRDVVVPLDGSETSAQALGAAKAISEILGGALHIVHVSEMRIPKKDLPALLKIEDESKYDIRKLSGEIVPAVLEFALETEARLIVMSSHGTSFKTQDILGSKAKGIAQHTTIPIMIIRAGMKKRIVADWRPAKMLVPLDGMPLPEYVSDTIFSIAEALHTDLDLLNIAAAGKKPPRVPGAFPSPAYLDHPYYDWPAWCSEFVKRILEEREPQVELTLFSKGGDPVRVTLQFALENSDDIVALHWRGLMSKKHAETVKGILRNAEKPVLLVRHFE
ncbi:MAG: hypothetical protein A2W01_01575 [Candidatus Solincola sediminis]|uniref:UspA domain-containing protein n=1 Tax=Candidatus Solincola sediminis TaxID=1797199 RepID=A0A1F2WKD3_9ACTN|nr:MAG: hypothetical protein A2Y75_07730 [Candidatus Solincola sediminis]OFW58799.1 MAG: hypothetical protein A2W01_01575 [Candidatus Solincola sediminis]